LSFDVSTGDNTGGLSSLPFKLDEGYLIASMLWSAVGGGFWIYGKKQRSAPALYGGIVMIAVSWLITSALWMSLSCIGIMAGIYYWARMED
jgi:hypothetical protein